MTRSEFMAGILRLNKRYGDKYYPSEVTNLIYEEVRTLDMKWWDNLITKLIATSKFAPLLPQIKVESIPEKLKFTKQTRSEHRAPNSMFTHEETLELFQTLSKVSRGLLSEEETLSYARLIKETVDEYSPFKPRCSLCNDEGIRLLEVVGALPYAYRCKCQRGLMRREDYPVGGN